jgi:5-methyltetrahydrofolate corrinoid/iron sulfur protein methyltransferase
VNTTMTTASSTTAPTAVRPFSLIGELMNNSFARARDAFQRHELAKYQQLAQLQSDLGADFLTLNIDGTQSMRVRKQEMLAFLPELVPAIQEATGTPVAFDNPDVDFHAKALSVYRRMTDNQPILNSLAASRTNLDRMIELVAEYDTKVIVMASEKFAPGGGAQCLSACEVHETTRRFVEILRERAARSNDDIIIDPGLAPIAADTYGLVNMSLDAMRLIRADPDLAGVHISVGLTNFSFGVPKSIREGLENAYITLGLEAGLDVVLGNPEKHLHPLADDSKYVTVVREALAAGRPQPGETQEDAGFRQSAKIMDLF